MLGLSGTLSYTVLAYLCILSCILVDEGVCLFPLSSFLLKEGTWSQDHLLAILKSKSRISIVIVLSQVAKSNFDVLLDVIPLEQSFPYMHSHWCLFCYYLFMALQCKSNFNRNIHVGVPIGQSWIKRDHIFSVSFSYSTNFPTPDPFNWSPTQSTGPQIH